MCSFKFDNEKTEVRILKEGIFRVRVTKGGVFGESLLNRYGILKEQEGDSAGKYTFRACEEQKRIVFEGGKKSIEINLTGDLSKAGFSIEIPVEKTERLYGLGDESRDSIMKKGKKAIMLVKNVTSYGPIPYMMSSEGWGILINSTYEHTFDLACSDEKLVKIYAEKGYIDFYIFIGESMIEVLDLYTDVSGKPVMLPKFAYGFTYVENEEIDARGMLEDCLNFRREKIPCDIIGLEPGWMEKHYDFSVDKKWDNTRFYIPYWREKGYCGSWSFFFNLRKMGFKLSLWLCCDYDLLWEEEKSSMKLRENSYDGAAIIDEHFTAAKLMDNITKHGESWFEHLKQFVDNGAAAFKLDGANQVLEHPDRLWAGKYLDDEVHNVYPVIYAKQMKEGFENYTGRRSLIYTPSLYAGTQQYAATWAGDTGGGIDTLISVLNLSMCGHTNSSCDFDPTDICSIHYGFLMPWTQLLGWRSWHQPWFMGEETENIMRDYANLRSSLFPYIYSMAHKASKTGLPVARPLSLMYPEHEEYDKITNMYMFGDSLLVGAFDMHLTLPEGRWTDYWTGEEYEGGCEIDYVPPKGKGGALFVKAGSVFVTQEPTPYLDKPYEGKYFVNIYPQNDCEFDFVQDDGITYGYLDGEMLVTKISCSQKNAGYEIVISEREGKQYGKKVEYEFDINEMSENNKANIKSTEPLRPFEIRLHTDKSPEKVMINGETTEFEYENGTVTINIAEEVTRPCRIEAV